MKALIWKEAREKIWWCVALAACGGGYFFNGNISPLERFEHGAILIVASLVIPLLMGASVYSSEFSRDKAAFLFCKPVSWTTALLAKMVVGFGMLALAAVVGMVAFRLSIPGPYLRIAGPGELAMALGQSLFWTGWLFLFGIGCSVLIPGIAGGLLLLIIQLVPFAFLIWRLEGIELFLLLPGFIGVLLVAKKGLSAPLSLRFQRYLAGWVAGLVVAVALGAAVHMSGQTWKQQITYFTQGPKYKSVSISPDGKYAISVRSGNVYWMDMRTGRKARLAQFRGWDSTLAELLHWSPPHKAYLQDSGKLQKPAHWWLPTWSKGGRIVKARSIDMGRAVYFTPVPSSPSGRIAAFVVVRHSDTRQRFVFVDINAVRKLSAEPEVGDSFDVSSYRLPNSLPVWWNSENDIGYEDKYGRTHHLRVPTEKGGA